MFIFYIGIPKKLLRKCRYGCPVNIEQFCKEWELLQNCKLIIANNNQ